MSIKSWPCKHPTAAMDIDDTLWQRFKDEDGWSIRMKARPVVDLPGPMPVHSYLSLHAPDGTLIGELHGLPFVRETGIPRGQASFSKNNDTLRVTFTERVGNPEVMDRELWSGNARQFLEKTAIAAELGQHINDQNIHYKPHILLRTALNSNTVAGNLTTQAMDLDLPREAQGFWWDNLIGWIMNLRRQFNVFSDGREVRPQIWAPGLGRNLSEDFARESISEGVMAMNTEDLRTHVRFSLAALGEDEVGREVNQEYRTARRERDAYDPNAGFAAGLT